MYAYVEFPTMMRACVVVGISDTCFVSLYHEFCSNGFSIDSFLSSLIPLKRPVSMDNHSWDPLPCQLGDIHNSEEAKEERRRQAGGFFILRREEEEEGGVRWSQRTRMGEGVCKLYDI